MKHFAASLSLAFMLMSGVASSADSDLIIYTYDSFAAKGGLGPEIVPLFEKKCGCRVRLLASGDAGQLLSRIQLDAERKKPTAHLVLGLDQYLWGRAKPFLEVWDDGWLPKGFNKLDENYRVEKGFLPFDYGVLAMMADMQALKKAGLKAPTSLRELQDPQWKKRFILQNPKTSTPGLAFFLLSRMALKTEVWDYWKRLSKQWLLMAPGWDGAYGLFLRGEAPLVWSYLTSQAYHREHGDMGSSPRYQAILFDEGQPLQIEGAALVKGSFRNSQERLRARQFLDFLLSDEVQGRIALKNWMLPVLEPRAQTLPASFRSLPKPKKLIRATGTPEELDALLEHWSLIVGTANP